MSSEGPATLSIVTHPTSTNMSSEGPATLSIVTSPISTNMSSGEPATLSTLTRQTYPNMSSEGPATLPNGTDNSETVPNASPTHESKRYTTYLAENPHHTIRFDYPAFDLIPPKHRIIIPQPSDARFRPQPDAQEYQILTRPINILHIMDPRLEDVVLHPSFGVVLSPEAVRIFKVIDGLATLTGLSTLSVVMYRPDSGVRITVRVMISTEGWTGNCMVDLASGEWEWLLRIERPWVKILDDLVNRKTAMTWFGVREKLLRRNWALWSREKELWGGEWARQVPRPAMESLKERLGCAEEDGWKEAYLRCGHWMCTLPEGSEGLTEEICRTEGCTVCGIRILDDSEISEAEAFDRLKEYERSKEIQCSWHGLDAAPTSSLGMIFYPEDLVVALEAALHSLKPPECIESKYNSPYYSGETAVASAALKKNWSRMSREAVYYCPKYLTGVLEKMSFHALRKWGTQPRVPTGWTAFFRLWLSRAVNITSQRICTSGEKGHQDVHVHSGDGGVYLGVRS